MKVRKATAQQSKSSRDIPIAIVAEVAGRWLKARIRRLLTLVPTGVWSPATIPGIFLASAITPDDFRRFEQVALEVLAEDDPYL